MSHDSWDLFFEVFRNKLRVEAWPSSKLVGGLHRRNPGGLDWVSCTSVEESYQFRLRASSKCIVSYGICRWGGSWCGNGDSPKAIRIEGSCYIRFFVVLDVHILFLCYVDAGVVEDTDVIVACEFTQAQQGFIDIGLFGGDGNTFSYGVFTLGEKLYSPFVRCAEAAALCQLHCDRCTVAAACGQLSMPNQHPGLRG